VHDIRPCPFHHFGTLHFGQIEREANVIVQREYEPLCMFDTLTVIGHGWQLMLGSFGIDRQYGNVVARLGQVAAFR
jgi:hypothetical protein